MSDVTEIVATRRPDLRRLLAPLAHQFWTIVLIVTVGTLASLAYGRMQVPQFEASAVLQVQIGTDTASVAEHILNRDNLLSVATRHGLSFASAGSNRAKTAVWMRRAVTVQALTSDAGRAMGFAPQVAGLVVSVLLPDAEAAARVANDLAQQILDDGNAGRLDGQQQQLDFYRRDELRLWQEVSALKTEQDRADGTVGAADAAVAAQRQLMLMQDQYDVVRQKLADAEIAARLASHLQAGQFSLLARATATEAVNYVQNWMVIGVAGSLLLAVALAFVLERRYPALRRGPWRELASLRDRVAHLYRMFDDPDRPILGVPRYMVTTALIVVWLYLAAGLIR